MCKAHRIIWYGVFPLSFFPVPWFHQFICCVISYMSILLFTGVNVATIFWSFFRYRHGEHMQCESGRKTKLSTFDKSGNRKIVKINMFDSSEALAVERYAFVLAIILFDINEFYWTVSWIIDFAQKIYYIYCQIHSSEH